MNLAFCTFGIFCNLDNSLKSKQTKRKFKRKKQHSHGSYKMYKFE